MLSSFCAKGYVQGLEVTGVWLCVCMCASSSLPACCPSVDHRIRDAVFVSYKLAMPETIKLSTREEQFAEACFCGGPKALQQ